MLTRLSTAVLVVLLLNLAVVNTAFATNLNDRKSEKREAKIVKRTAEVKAGVLKLGPGKHSIVKVKLGDKTTVKGYIVDIDDNGFTVADEAGNATVVDYTAVKQIKGNNLHAGVWIAIGAGIAVGVLFIIVAIGLRDGS